MSLPVSASEWKTCGLLDRPYTSVFGSSLMDQGASGACGINHPLVAWKTSRLGRSAVSTVRFALPFHPTLQPPESMQSGSISIAVPFGVEGRLPPQRNPVSHGERTKQTHSGAGRDANPDDTLRPCRLLTFPKRSTLALPHSDCFHEKTSFFAFQEASFRLHQMSVFSRLAHLQIYVSPFYT